MKPRHLFIGLDVDFTVTKFKELISANEKIYYIAGLQLWRKCLLETKETLKGFGIPVHYGIITAKPYADDFVIQILEDLKDLIDPELVFFVGDILSKIIIPTEQAAAENSKIAEIRQQTLWQHHSCKARNGLQKAIQILEKRFNDKISIPKHMAYIIDDYDEICFAAAQLGYSAICVDNIADHYIEQQEKVLTEIFNVIIPQQLTQGFNFSVKNDREISTMKIHFASTLDNYKKSFIKITNMLKETEGRVIFKQLFMPLKENVPQSFDENLREIQLYDEEDDEDDIEPGQPLPEFTQPSSPIPIKQTLSPLSVIQVTEIDEDDIPEIKPGSPPQEKGSLLLQLQSDENYFPSPTSPSNSTKSNSNIITNDNMTPIITNGNTTPTSTSIKPPQIIPYKGKPSFWEKQTGDNQPSNITSNKPGLLSRIFGNR